MNIKNNKNTATTKGKNPPSKIAQTSNRKYKNYILAALLFFTAIVYWPSLKNDFVAGDDYIIIVNNPDIRSFENVPKFFSQPYHEMYCPVKMISHTIDYQFSHDAQTLQPTPAGFHFFSLLYHLINIALLFYLLYLLFPNIWAAAAGALLFAIHPMNVEAVAWITGRGDLLYAGFFFGGLIAYVHYIKKGLKPKYLIYTFLLFALSALSKASAMTFPLVLIVFDWFYQRKLFSKRVILEKIPFLLGALALGISAIMMRGGDSVSLTEYLSHFSGVDSFVIFLYPLSFYLAHFFVPLKMALPYPHPYASNLPLTPDFFLFPIILVILAILIWRFKTIRRPLTFALLFYFAALISAMRLTPMLGTIAADRYFYVAIAGIVFFIGWSFMYLSEHRNLLKKRTFPLFIIVFSLFAISMTAMTYTRIKVFKNGITLFGDAHEKYPQHTTPLYELSGAYMQAGMYDNALQVIDRVVKIAPNSIEAYNTRYKLLFYMQRYPEALKDIEKLTELDSDAINYYMIQAYLCKMLNQPEKALKAVDTVLSKNPDPRTIQEVAALREELLLQLEQ